MTQIRLSEEICKVVSALTAEGGLYPEHSGRSVVQVATALIKESPTFQRAKKQLAGERHPRPGVAMKG
jgi:hypothetical protein